MKFSAPTVIASVALIAIAGVGYAAYDQATLNAPFTPYEVEAATLHRLTYCSWRWIGRTHEDALKSADLLMTNGYKDLNPRRILPLKKSSLEVPCDQTDPRYMRPSDEMGRRPTAN